MDNYNKGQDQTVWTNKWGQLTSESEIQMWDYFGLRPWILKFTPRHGKVIEAGCGLGRFVFYLGKLGIEIEGLDFSDDLISYLKNWQKKYNYNYRFVCGNVKELPYDNSTISGYLSFGVLEHFEEGPLKPLMEAARVLRPGGIAIISTPNLSWNVIRRKTLKRIKTVLKIVLGQRRLKQPFFQ